MEKIIEKKARRLNDYEQLSLSNRVNEKRVFHSMSKEANASLEQYLLKTAKELNRNVLDLQYGMLEKQANSIDAALAMKAGNMVLQRLGIDPQNSIDMVSQVVKNTLRIQEVYGGDADLIMSRLLDEIENTMAMKQQGKIQSSQQEIDNMHQNIMNPFRAKKKETTLKFELMKAIDISSAEAEQLTKSVMSEARDLLIPLRPFSVEEICDALVQVIQRFNDSTIVYGIHNNPGLISQLKTILAQGR